MRRYMDSVNVIFLNHENCCVYDFKANEIEAILKLLEFRRNCNCSEHVLALTTYIVYGFQRQLKTSLTSGSHLMCKNCNIFNNMLSNRYFLHVEERTSRWRVLNSRLPQGRVLLPALLYSIPCRYYATTIFLYLLPHRSENGMLYVVAFRKGEVSLLHG